VERLWNLSIIPFGPTEIDVDAVSSALFRKPAITGPRPTTVCSPARNDKTAAMCWFKCSTYAYFNDGRLVAVGIYLAIGSCWSPGRFFAARSTCWSRG